MRDYELDRTAPRAPRHGPASPAPAAPATAGPATAGAVTAGPAVVARSPALDAASLLHLQRTAGNASVVQLLGDDEGAASPVQDVVGSGRGSPLEPGVRSSMEGAFGTSFDHVRVHTDERASKSAESVGANAYTVGSDVVFRSGQFDPGTPTGQRTLAHELAHVVQQGQGPVDGTDAPGGIRMSSPSDRFEVAAEETANDVVASVQRAVAPDEEEEELPG
jgi:Domain of unknown function (DUF4157)